MQSIIAEKREVFGKKVKNLRNKGFLPAILYGKAQKAEPITVPEIDFFKLWKSAGESTIVELRLGDKNNNVLIQDVMIDPIKSNPVHADFYVVDMDRPIKVDVVLEFIGESEAVKSGGILVKVLYDLSIEALPKDLPHSIPVDISSLRSINDSIAVRDLKIPSGVTVLSNIEDTIILVEPPRSEAEIKSAPETAPSLENIEVISKKPKAEGEAEEGQTKEENA